MSMLRQRTAVKRLSTGIQRALYTRVPQVRDHKAHPALAPCFLSNCREVTGPELFAIHCINDFIPFQALMRVCQYPPLQVQEAAYPGNSPGNVLGSRSFSQSAGHQVGAE